MSIIAGLTPTWVVKRTTETEPTISGAGIPVGGMSFFLPAGRTFWYEFRLLVGTSSASQPATVGFSFGGVTSNYHAGALRIATAADGLDSDHQFQFGNTFGQDALGNLPANAPTADDYYLAIMSGVVNLNRRGFLFPTFASSGIGVSASVRAGSIGKMYRVE